MADIIVPRFQLVDLAVPGVPATGQTGTRFFFSDQPFLRHAIHKAVEVYFDTDVTISPISNNNVTGSGINVTAFLTLVQSGTEMAQKVPLVKLHNLYSSNSGPYVPALWLVQNWNIDWSKSYVELTAAPANTTNLSFLFGVYYLPGSDSNS